MYSTTTANYHNPAMHMYHIYFHKKWEKKLYYPQREKEIKKLYPAVSTSQLKQLAVLTRGKAQQDFVNAVTGFMNGEKIENDPSLRSNTCDCITGVWNEHLLTRKEYAGIIGGAGFKMEYSPGFWDTHYNSTVINMLVACLNKIISLTGNRGVLISPFVNVIAYN